MGSVVEFECWSPCIPKHPRPQSIPGRGRTSLGMPPWFAAQCTRRSCGSEFFFNFIFIFFTPSQPQQTKHFSLVITGPLALRIVPGVRRVLTAGVAPTLMAGCVLKSCDLRECLRRGSNPFPISRESLPAAAGFHPRRCALRNRWRVPASAPHREPVVATSQASAMSCALVVVTTVSPSVRSPRRLLPARGLGAGAASGGCASLARGVALSAQRLPTPRSRAPRSRCAPSRRVSALARVASRLEARSPSCCAGAARREHSNVTRPGLPFAPGSASAARPTGLTSSASKSPLQMSPTWYVTVEVRPGALPRPRSPRLTSTFETEAEAKNFARTKLREGRMVFAGTINPFTPRRTVPSHDIAAWVADEQEHSADLENRGSISESQT